MQFTIFRESKNGGNYEICTEEWSCLAELIEHYGLPKMITFHEIAKGWGEVKHINWYGPIGIGEIQTNSATSRK
jgi:hypothetical protein